MGFPVNNGYYLNLNHKFQTDYIYGTIQKQSDRLYGTGIQKLGTESSDDPGIRLEKRMGIRECQTCQNRKYQDGSDDPGVSFKTPGHIDPNVSASVVKSHEMEHVSNENARAIAENREVVSQSVSLQTSVCPECGKAYVSGGTTRTTTKSKPENERDFFKENLKAFMSNFSGNKVDIKV